MVQSISQYEFIYEYILEYLSQNNIIEIKFPRNLFKNEDEEEEEGINN